MDHGQVFAKVQQLAAQLAVERSNSQTAAGEAALISEAFKDAQEQLARCAMRSRPPQTDSDRTKSCTHTCSKALIDQITKCLRVLIPFAEVRQVLCMSKAPDSHLCPLYRLNAEKASVPVAPGQPDLGSCAAALQEASRQLDHLLLQQQLTIMSLGSLPARGDKHLPRAPKMLHQCFSFKEPTRIVAEGLADALDIIAGKNLSESLHRSGMGHVQKLGGNQAHPRN